MSVLIFLAVLFVLILVHELGHFVVAKWTGMRVDEFGIGFPPKLFGVKKGETVYSLNALPIGGFVRILGEDPAAAVDEPDRAFGSKNRWAQAAVLVAGVFMNVLFAWLVFAFVLMVGVPTVVDEASASAEAELVVTEVLPESPALEAGIPHGARIVRVAAEEETLETPTPSSFTAFTVAHADEELQVTYRSHGEETVVSVSPETDVIGEDSARPAIGIALALIERQTTPFVPALLQAAVTTATTLALITTSITSLLLDAVTFSADLSDVAGPVGIVGLVGDAADYGVASVLMFMAVISLNLAVVNMLPFPALDGGRLLFVLVEAIIRRPIDPLWAARLNYAGFVILILLMLAVTFNDILRIL